MRDSKRDTDVKNSLLDSGRRRVWDDLREQHWNMYIIICETDRQSRFDAWDRVLRAVALGWPWGMGWGGSWEGVQDGEHMYIHDWFMSLYGKNHDNIVISLQLKEIN